MEKKVSIIIPVYNQEKLIVKALDSIPARDDIEVIVVDDCSTDNTLEVLKNYTRLNLELYHNNINMGVGYSENVGHNVSIGEWWVRLDSDDYFYTNLSDFIDKYLTDNYDLVYFDIDINTGSVWTNHQAKGACCGAVKFVRKSFMGDLRCPEVKCAEDYYLHNALLEKNPRIKYSKILLKHYNYPRDGSLTDLRKKGLITDENN